MTQKKQTETTKRKSTNEIIEDHGDWLLVDISTPKHPDATMAVDTDVFHRHEGGRILAVLNNTCKYIYAQCCVNKKLKQFHRTVINAGDLCVDHIKHGSKSFIDNRVGNLRVATYSQNNMNVGLQRNNTSGTTGVLWDKYYSCWKSQISINGKNKHLGFFDNIDIAIGARQQAEREYFGEFAYKGDVK